MGKSRGKIDYVLISWWCGMIVAAIFIVFGVYEGRLHMKEKERIFHLKCTLGDHLIFNNEIRYGDYYLDAHVVKIKTKGTISSVYDTCTERMVKDYD